MAKVKPSKELERWWKMENVADTSAAYAGIAANKIRQSTKISAAKSPKTGKAQTSRKKTVTRNSKGVKRRGKA